MVAVPASASYRELGQVKGQKLPQSSCPQDCEGIGQVTGYQVQVGSAKNPYQVNRPGKITAWSIRLGKPDANQVQFFTNLFGPKATGRISILSIGHRDRKAKLVSQSPVVQLNPYFGSSPTFALDKPLAVGPRNVVALTIPTWAPAFAVKLGADQAWRSSRSQSNCNDVQQKAAHQTVGSTKAYGCFYRTARLVYTATYVPNPKPTSAPAK